MDPIALLVLAERIFIALPPTLWAIAAIWGGGGWLVSAQCSQKGLPLLEGECVGVERLQGAAYEGAERGRAARDRVRPHPGAVASVPMIFGADAALDLPAQPRHRHAESTDPFAFRPRRPLSEGDDFRLWKRPLRTLERDPMAAGQTP